MIARKSGIAQSGWCSSSSSSPAPPVATASAFACHPRIGERPQRRSAHAVARSAAWSKQEQSSAASASKAVLAEIAAGNARYEKLFGFTYIVCATGKSADEMLAILKRRLASNRRDELLEAAEQQRQITQIRLGKWLVE